MTERAKIEVYDFAPICPDKRFIKKLLDKVATKIPPDTMDYHFVVFDNQGTDPTVKATPGAALVPSAQEIGRLMVRSNLVKRYEYRIKVAHYEGEENVIGADRMEILPLMLGNIVNLYKDKVPVLSIPVNAIDVSPVVQLDQGFVGPKRNLLLDLHFGDGAAHAMRIDVEDKDGAEIVDHLRSLKKREEALEQSIEYEYFDDSNWLQGKMYPSLPVLADGENVIRTDVHTEGIFSKHVRWIKALINMRVLFYDFETNASDAVALPRVESVVVMNKRTESVSNYSGQSTRYYANRSSWGQSDGQKHTTTVTLGDVAFVTGGAPVVTFVSVDDPEGFATMARLAVQESSKLLRPKDQELGKFGESLETQAGVACRKCGAPNPPGSSFCTKCGKRL